MIIFRSDCSSRGGESSVGIFYARHKESYVTFRKCFCFGKPAVDDDLRLTLSCETRNLKTEQDLPLLYQVLKPTLLIGDLIWYAAAEKSCALNTQHQTQPVILCLTGHEMTPNLGGYMIRCCCSSSESARYQVWGSSILWGRSSRSRHRNLTHFWPAFFFRRNY